MHVTFFFSKQNGILKYYTKVLKAWMYAMQIEQLREKKYGFYYGVCTEA